MKTLREYIDILESFSVSQPLAEGVMDRLRRIYMGLVYDRPWGTPDSEFLAQWQREIKAQLGQDIDLDTLARLQQNFRERGQTMMSRGDWADYDREMGIREQGVAEGPSQKQQKELAYNQGMEDYDDPEVTIPNYKSWGQYAKYYIKGWKSAQELEAGSHRDELERNPERFDDEPGDEQGDEQGLAEGSDETNAYDADYYTDPKIWITDGTNDYYADYYTDLLSQVKNMSWTDRATTKAGIKQDLASGRIDLATLKMEIRKLDRQIVDKKGVSEGSGMIWVVYRQETTLYPNGERDHETETVKTFTSEAEAEKYADKLNSAKERDIDEYYFVRGKKQGVAEGSDEKYSYRVTFDDGTHNTVAIPVAKIFQGGNSAKDLITRHFARKGRTVKDIEMMFRPDSVQEGDQELEETQQVEEDPVARITRLHQELSRR